jgi:dipeptidyl aminopeptidase/acylaminoacyl peptidase
VSFSRDANTIIYVRGEEKNVAGQYGNPTSDPAGVQLALWAVDWKGGAPRKIDEGGREAQISAKGWVAYDKDGQIWIAPLDGSEKPKQIVTRGNCSNPQWSPDGGKLAFVAGRGDHAFIAIYDVSAKSIRYIAPSVDRDGDPVWSLDGKRIAFVRRPAEPRMRRRIFSRRQAAPVGHLDSRRSHRRSKRKSQRLRRKALSAWRAYWRRRIGGLLTISSPSPRRKTAGASYGVSRTAVNELRTPGDCESSVILRRQKDGFSSPQI